MRSKIFEGVLLVKGPAFKKRLASTRICSGICLSESGKGSVFKLALVLIRLRSE